MARRGFRAFIGANHSQLAQSSLRSLFGTDFGAFSIQTSIVCAQWGKAPSGLQKVLMALETSVGI